MKLYVVLFTLAVFAACLARAQTAKRNDVVIDEIMADPTPQVGLPNAEWIELKNTSSSGINLAGWRLGKAGSQSGPLPAYVLQPDSFAIVCTGSAVNAMSTFGPSISVTNFPSLNNDEDQLWLRSDDNKIITAVNYTDAWYGNELKKAGGWTLEMIDTKNPCGGATNWKAATDNKGGTPGKINSSDGVHPDDVSPVLRRAFAVDSLTLSLVFDEPLDSLRASAAGNYDINNGIGKPLAAVVVSPFFNTVNLKLASPLAAARVYTITANMLTDCSGNIIGSHNTAKLGLPSAADSSDVVINEILFNPGPDGVDYVELYNRSAKNIDLKRLYIANRNSTGIVSSIQPLSVESILIFPGDFIVITQDPAVVQRKYSTLSPDAFLQLRAMPSFPNDKGDVIVLNDRGEIVDEVRYSDKWHFELITNTEGISLERIDYNGPSVQSNFHSAATSAGYGTPGYKNSQFRSDVQVAGEVVISPQIFSPDNDGMDDFATINYTFPSPGFVTNITIFDASGRPVRYLQRNALCGVRGSFVWDGLGEKQQKLSQGIYIFFTEVFNTAGKKKQFKNTVVLARRG